VVAEVLDDHPLTTDPDEIALEWRLHAAST
jgi:hypothetical protein